MSYETLRFGWQKLLVNQVPQKGGRGYAPAAPPPPDYAGQWQAAQNALNSAQPVIQQTILSQSQIVSDPASAPNIVQNNNNAINAKIAEIDGSINQVTAIPDSVWEGTSFSKSEALNVLNTTRRNLAMCIATVPPPPPPPPLPYTPPPTSSVLQSPLDLGPVGLFSPVGGALGALSGITVPGISAVSGQSICGLPQQNPPPPPACVFPAQPSIRVPEVEFYPQQPAVVAGRGTWSCDGPILGVGTWRVGETGRIRGEVDEVWAEDGNQYPTPKLVPAGLRYSYTRWKFTPEFVPPPPPPPVYIPQPVIRQQTETEFYRQQVDSQTAQLRQLNRIMNKPIDAAPPENIYPPTSWQYEFWQKGYSLKEISFAEETASKLNLLGSTGGDFALFKVKVEDLLQDAIISKQVEPAITQEIVPLPPPPPVIGFDSRTGYATTVTNFEAGSLTSQPFQPLVPAISEPVKETIPPPVCELPMPFIDPRTQKPADPKIIPPALRINRRFISRRNFNRPINLEDMPQVATCAPNTVPTKGNWEDALLGAGATVAELDTIRRTMAQTKFTPNADLASVAQGMLASTRAQVASTAPALIQGSPNNKIDGVASCTFSPINVVKSNAIARARTQQARRGVLTSRNKRPSSGLSGSF